MCTLSVDDDDDSFPTNVLKAATSTVARPTSMFSECRWAFAAPAIIAQDGRKRGLRIDLSEQYFVRGYEPSGNQTTTAPKNNRSCGETIATAPPSFAGVTVLIPRQQPAPSSATPRRPRGKEQPMPTSRTSVTRSVQRMRTLRRVATVGFCAVLAASMAACGTSSSTGDATTDIDACDRYVAAYRACLSHASDSAHDAVERRVALTRDAFAASAHDKPSRARLAETCESGLVRLGSCR
jgi:hypothetical protein